MQYLQPSEVPELSQNFPHFQQINNQAVKVHPSLPLESLGAYRQINGVGSRLLVQRFLHPI